MKEQERLYKVRMWKMDETRWAHRVYEWSGQGSKWVRASIKWERKCGLVVGEAAHCLFKALPSQLMYTKLSTILVIGLSSEATPSNCSWPNFRGKRH